MAIRNSVVVIGGGSQGGSFFWSPALQGQIQNGTSVGNFTFGFIWQFLRAVTVTGVRLFGTWAGTKNIRIRVYNLSDGVLTYNETFNGRASGLQSLNFASTLNLLPNKNYVISAYVTDGTIYLAWPFSSTANGNTLANGYPSIIGPDTIVRGTNFAAGDANPTSTSAGWPGGTHYSMVEPLFV